MKSQIAKTNWATRKIVKYYTTGLIAQLFLAIWLITRSAGSCLRLGFISFSIFNLFLAIASKHKMTNTKILSPWRDPGPRLGHIYRATAISPMTGGSNAGSVKNAPLQAKYSTCGYQSDPRRNNCFGILPWGSFWRNRWCWWWSDKIWRTSTTHYTGTRGSWFRLQINKICVCRCAGTTPDTCARKPSWL